MTHFRIGSRMRLLIGALGTLAIAFAVSSFLNQTKWRYTASLRSTQALYLSTALTDGRILFNNPDPDSSDPVEIFDPKLNAWSYLSKKEASAKFQITLAHPEELQTTKPFFISLMSFEYSNLPAQPYCAFIAPDAYVNLGQLNRLHIELDQLPFSDFEGGRGNNYKLFNLVPLANGKVFVGGGISLSPREPGHPVYDVVFDPKANTFIRLTDGEYGFGQTATLLPSGKILLAGGLESIPLSLSQTVWFRAKWMWSTSLTPFEEIYNIGMTKRCRIYDPATNTCRETYQLNTPRAFHTANLLPDGRVLVTGGFTRSEDTATTNTCEIISLKDMEQ